LDQLIDADEIGDSKFDALPERVQVALGEPAGAAKEGAADGAEPDPD